MPPKLKRVERLDSLPLNDTYYTEEGYLHDRPILTSTGIFEYTNPNGTIRRELRLPEDVFDKDSLASYRGKPIVITHDAGLIDKDNVHENQVGTILSEGYQSGNDVRAEIIVHDTDGMKQAGLKELSLGYNLDLDETPGVWQGRPYDAIQRNIRINHLALVLEARAGEQARLNIDSRVGKTIYQGGTSMTKKKNTRGKTSGKTTRRADGILTPEELAKAIEEYKARSAARIASKVDEDEEVVSTEPPMIGGQVEEDDEEEKETIIAPSGSVPDIADPEEKAQFVKDRRDRRDEEGDPETQKEAMGVIAQQDEDIDILFDIIDTLLAERDFKAQGDADDEEEIDAPVATEDDDEEQQDFPPEDNEDEDEDFPPKDEENEDDEEEENEDDDDDVIPNTNESEVGKSVLNVDSVDKIIRQRVQLGLVGEILHMDGLESMNLRKAKKRVIRAARPGVRLDGKSNAYIDAAFDCAVADIRSRAKKDTNYQKRQMFNQDSAKARRRLDEQSSDAARERMIARQMNKKEVK